MWKINGEVWNEDSYEWESTICYIDECIYCKASAYELELVREEVIKEEPLSKITESQFMCNSCGDSFEITTENTSGAFYIG